MGAAKEFRRDFPKQIAEKVAELEGWLRKHNSFDVLATLTALELYIDPETYKEPTHEHGDALVEYASQLCLKSTFSSGTEPFVNKAYQDVVERLREIIEMTILYYGLEGADEPTDAPRLDELHRETVIAELLIRNPGYPHHLDESLFSLFQPFDAWLLNSVGFTVTDLLSIEKSVRKLTNTRFNERRNTAKALEKEFNSEFEEFKRSQHARSDLYRMVTSRGCNLCQMLTRRTQSPTSSRRTLFCGLGDVLLSQQQNSPRLVRSQLIAWSRHCARSPSPSEQFPQILYGQNPIIC